MPAPRMFGSGRHFLAFAADRDTDNRMLTVRAALNDELARSRVD